MTSERSTQLAIIMAGLLAREPVDDKAPRTSAAHLNSLCYQSKQILNTLLQEKDELLALRSQVDTLKTMCKRDIRDNDFLVKRNSQLRRENDLLAAENKRLKDGAKE